MSKEKTEKLIGVAAKAMRARIGEKQMGYDTPVVDERMGSLTIDDCMSNIQEVVSDLEVYIDSMGVECMGTLREKLLASSGDIFLYLAILHKKLEVAECQC